MRSDSLLKNGTWAFLGSSTNKSDRYLFWTSVDTNAVGAGKQIPVIVSSANGGFLHFQNDHRDPEQQGRKLCCDYGPYQQLQQLSDIYHRREI